MRHRGQTALARDVAVFRTRFGRGRATAPRRAQDTERRNEGLDERGEAPPPYMEGGKPPSISAGAVGHQEVDVSVHSGEGVELRPMSSGNGRVPEPPGYLERSELGAETDMARPTAAVIAGERYGSTRRLLSSSGDSHHE